MAPLLTEERSVIDATVTASLRALADPGEPDVYTEIVRLFLADAPLSLSALETAVAAGSAVPAWEIAHRLRGSALDMGARRMATACAAIERAARAGSLDDASAQIEHLRQEFAAVRDALEENIQ